MPESFQFLFFATFERMDLNFQHPEYRLRLAKIEDLPVIVDIYNLSIPGGLATADTEPVSVASRLDWFNAHQPENRPLLVLEKDEKIAAWLSFKSFYGRPAYSITAEIGIYLHPEHQGKKLGTSLLQKAIAIAPDLGIENLLGFIFGHNSPSLKLFGNEGFETWGTLPEVGFMREHYVDLLILGKKISATK